MIFTEVFWVNGGKWKEENRNQETVRFENAMCRVLHEKSNISASFEEHLKFQEKLIFTYALWVNCGKSK